MVILIILLIIPEEQQHVNIEMLKEIKNINKSNIPLKFKILDIKNGYCYKIYCDS